MKEISSRDNPAVRQYTLLATSRKARIEQARFVTEGFRLTRDACLSGCVPEALYVTAAAWEKYHAELEPFGEFIRVTDSVGAKLSNVVASQGVFGLFHMPKPRIPDWKGGGRYLLLNGLQDPGNVGTILRTACALGIDGVGMTPDCPEPYSPKCLRASMGGVFRVPLIVQSFEELAPGLRKAGVKMWAAALSPTAIPVQQAGLGAGCAVVIGNEGSGLKPQDVQLCDGTVQIPMSPGSESLNAAMAAGIFLWEMLKEKSKEWTRPLDIEQ